MSNQKEGFSRDVVLGPFRANFVQITDDKGDKGQWKDGTKYIKKGMQLIIVDGVKPIVDQLQEMCKEAVIQRYGELSKAPSNLKKPILSGNKAKNVEEYTFYKDAKYISTTAYVTGLDSVRKGDVSLIGADGQVAIGEPPPADGTYVRVKLFAKTYTGKSAETGKAYQPGVSFRLRAVQALPTSEAQKMMEGMGWSGDLDDSPLGGEGGGGPAQEGFSAFDDGSTSRPEDYTEPEQEDDFNFMEDED